MCHNWRGINTDIRGVFLMSKLHNKAQEILEDLISNELAWSDEASDYIHESVDGHENVIYYRQAHDLCQALEGDEERWALEWLEDVGCKPASYDDWATQIAYAALYTATADLLDEWRNDHDNG